MAEVLAVVASGVSIASIAIQIVGSIEKLSDVWSSIRDAPENIKALLKELAQLANLLAVVDESNACYEPTTPIQSALTQAKKDCQEVADSIKEVVKELAAGLAASRGRRQWTAVKARLKEKRLVRYQKRLESAKLTLVIALQCYHARQVLLELFGRTSSDNSKLARERPPSSFPPAVSGSQ